MAHTLPYPDAGEDAVADPERRATTGTNGRPLKCAELAPSVWRSRSAPLC